MRECYLLNFKEVCEFYGLSEQTIRRRIKESKEGTGTFPRPVFGHKRKALWYLTDLEDWRETKQGQNR